MVEFGGLYTIGYGDRETNSVLLQAGHLVDVRSVPFSKRQPAFSGTMLGKSPRRHGQAFMAGFFRRTKGWYFWSEFLRIVRRFVMANVQSSVGDITKLGWLADAPLFIDAPQVLAFYDAVVRPETEQKKITLSLKSLESQKTTTEGELTGEVSIAKWITTIFPFLDASVGGKVGASTESERGKEEGREVELQPISSPQRQLVQLALHYIVNLPTRIRIVSDPPDPTWSNPKFAQALPRALVFLDFPANSVFFPMAAELATGRVVLIYKAYLDAVKQKKPLPDEQDYWDPRNFDAQTAMRTIEEQAEGSRIRWIDYRTPFSEKGRTFHLHVVAHGDFDTGVFAYNFVKRGFRQGLRLVGTLKAGDDVNVLAIFEK